MTEIQPFVFPTTGQTVRTVVIDDEPWFVAADVAAALDLGNGHSSLALLDGDERGLHTVETPGGPQPMLTINEPGLFSFVLRSRKPEAKAFKRWVTHDVLPTIRKTGSYAVSLLDQDPLNALAEAHGRLGQAIAIAKAERNRADWAEVQVLELAPAARAWDELEQADGDYSVREAAIILKRDRRIDIGQQRLFAYLREIGWLDRHNVPYQRHVQCGRLVLRIGHYEHPKRDELVATQQARITPKGIRELHGLLGGGSQVDALISEQAA